MSFLVVKPGLLSLIQDFGRYGGQEIGYTQGGPMDEQAFLWANRLLDNSPVAAQIEITYGGFELLATRPTMAAVTGADLGATLNGRRILPWHRFRIEKQDKLTFDHPRQGLRAYLAVKGGLKVSPARGSCSTVMREKIGGLDLRGARLGKGDRIPYDGYDKSVPACIPPEFIPDYTAPLNLRLIPGYQHHHFPADALERLFTGQYVVSRQIDRMGYRLSGPPIHCPLQGIVSEGISYGAVQIPSDGQPIVLMKDRQTIGGYPKVGCVPALDAGQLAQRSPGNTLTFTPGVLEDIAAERISFNRFFGLRC